MPLVRVITWNQNFAPDHAKAITAAGFKVDASEYPSGRAVGHIRDLAPDAMVIDLDRLPSHGNAVAMVLRSSKSTCHVPIIFAGGAVDKVERIRQRMPDAVFVDWKKIQPAIKKAIRKAPPPPIKRVAYMEQWTGSSLAKKLDLKEAVALINAPDGFEELVGEVPEGVRFENTLTPRTKLVIWFVRSLMELESEVLFLAARLPENCPLWIAYLKRGARVKTDLSQTDVRASALAAGLVDYKICGIDSDWTGLKFTRRKTAQKPPKPR